MCYTQRLTENVYMIRDRLFTWFAVACRGRCWGATAPGIQAGRAFEEGAFWKKC